MIKTRIAPAPTGKFHIGSARTALFNYLFAKQNRGVFVARVEDTDKARSKKEYEDDILQGLRWLGLQWDEFYRQSERIGIYKKYIEKLLEEGRAYHCFHSIAETQGRVHFCEYSEQTVQKSKIKNQKSKVIRLKTPKDREVEFNDIVRGRVIFNTNEIGDFSLAKSPDEPLYNLAAVVDDYEIGITHIIRGEEHISNTPKQLLLQEALGFTPPIYAHIPLILGEDRSKLSKRRGATSLTEFRAEGYLPEAIINMIAFLGWNPGDEREFFTLSELVKEFSLERIKKGGAIFNKERLGFFNRHYIKTLPDEALAKIVRPFFEEEYGRKVAANFKNLKEAITSEQGRVKTLKELVKSLDFIFKLPLYDDNLLLWKNQTIEDAKIELEKSLRIIEKIPDTQYNKNTLEDIFLREAGKSDRGFFLWPLRVALSGKKTSPPPFEIAAALGKDSTIERITYAIQKISQFRSSAGTH